MRDERAVRRLELGAGRWELGEIVTLPMSCIWARIFT